MYSENPSLMGGFIIDKSTAHEKAKRAEKGSLPVYIYDCSSTGAQKHAEGIRILHEYDADTHAYIAVAVMHPDGSWEYAEFISQREADLQSQDNAVKPEDSTK